MRAPQILRDAILRDRAIRREREIVHKERLYYVRPHHRDSIIAARTR